MIGGGGIRLHVEESGVRDGTPILLVHGFSQSRLCWSRQVASELADEFRLVTFDLRGHGASEKPRDAYGDPALWADDVDAVIRELDLAQPVLVGWSYGGMVISDYLAAYGDAAIGGVNLVGAVSRVGTPEGLALLGPDFLALAPGFFSTAAEESVAALDTFMRLCVAGELPPAEHYFMLGYNAIVPPHVRHGLFARRVDQREALEKVRKPVLLTHGEADEVVLIGNAREHEQLIPHATTSYWPGIGHSPFWEDTPRFNAELAAFARST